MLSIHPPAGRRKWGAWIGCWQDAPALFALVSPWPGMVTASDTSLERT
jgi:hypothetical protein